MKSDTQIKDKILAERLDPKIKSSNIGLEVSDGDLTLSGYAETDSEKSNAEQAVRTLKDVHAITQELQALVPCTCIRSDTEITRKVHRIIRWSGIDTNNQIHIKVEKGVVTLSGKVETLHQKDIAQSYASNILGVKGINNLIEIEPKLSISIVKKNIQDALMRQAIHDVENVHVSIHQNKVTLAGKVKSWPEKNCVINAAWLAPKVNNVIDKLQIEPKQAYDVP